MSRPALDVRQILEARYPRVGRRLPAFAVEKLRSLLHEDELNAFFAAERGKPADAFVAACLERLQITTRVSGLEHLTDLKVPLFASNHPSGGLDGLLLIHVLWPVTGPVRVLVNDHLMAVKELADVFVPVNKFEGRIERRYVDILHAAFADPTPMVVFPAGEVSKDQHGRIKDVPWKKLFIQKARRHQRPVVPVYIHTRTSPEFQRFSKRRKRLRIKFPLEMALLPDELGYQVGRTIDVVFGEPINPASFTDDKPPEYWAQQVKDRVYMLSDGLPPLPAEPRSARYRGWNH